MRKSKVETAETRRRIVETAAREFRRNGVHATGLAEVMAATSLTHGGFYRHFNSKEELVVEASAAGMESIIERADAAARRPDGKSGPQAIVEAYLSMDHRDDPSEGCPLAGLGSELARASDETREVVSAGVLNFLELIAEQMPRRKHEAAKSDAIFVLSAMVGAITLSRIVTNPELSAAILRDTKRHLKNA
jgi:TetR/AcrR family transcriptional repressor of nem operon